MSTALSSQSKTSGQVRRVDPSVVKREKLVLEQLAAEMTTVQKRLGTIAERPGDCQLARDLAHAIRNKLHILRLWGVFGSPRPVKCDPNQMSLDI